MVKQELGRRTSRFWHDEDGALTYIAVAAALMTIAVGGLGIDMIHAELRRAKIQATLDRAVLAAADLDNTLVPDDVVHDYFAKMGLSDSLSKVKTEKGLGFKRVRAEGAAKVAGNFSSMIGVDYFDIGGVSVAEEYVHNVEVSLVLDISGSMAKNSRLVNMKNAAKTFVDTVIDERYPNQISISLVPYSEHVNPGPYIGSLLKVNWKHGMTHCLEIPDGHFNQTQLNTSHTYEQMQYFQWNYYGANEIEDTVCPQYDYEEISAFQTNRTVLKDQIEKFQPRAGTSIFMGMKWGVAFLDPSTQSIATGLITQGKAPAAMSGRPFSYDFTDTTKHVVLMTDGKHDKSFRIANWAYNDESDILHWSQNNLWYYLDNFVYDSWSWDSYYSERYNLWYGDALLDRICDAAKAQKITIWSIAFETDNHGKKVMNQCASSPAHYFDAEGTELTDVFYSIARSINQLRLTQ
ncbi:TadE/TadG family type IV pilus assembly protein [Pseudoprimorskyibacter insulae]|nr:TadE/TadG family type IV pilus assembly protein [Pseudoprimorskyibacter insulae]